MSWTALLLLFFFLNLLLPLHSPPSLSSVRVLGVVVLSRWLVPTLTPSLTRGVALSHRITGGLLRSQLVTVPTEDGVASLAGCQLLE